MLRHGIAKRIRKIRLERDYTVSELARRSRISRFYLIRLESKNPPRVTVETLAKIAGALGVSLIELLA